jgi:hypothetical protein
VGKVERAVQPGGDLPHEPSASSAWQKAAWTWTLVSSVLATSPSHLRETRSSITVTAGGRCAGRAAGAAADPRPAAPAAGWRATPTPAPETSRGGRACGGRSVSPHWWNSQTISAISPSSSPWTGWPPGARSSSRSVAWRASHRHALVSPAPAPGRRPAPSTRPGSRGRARPAARPWWPHPPWAGPGQQAPRPVSLHQRQLDRQLLDRLAPPGDLGTGRLQLGVSPGRLHPGLGAGQRRQRALAGDSRMRMIVDRSTASRSAASATVFSCRTSCSQISYVCHGDKNRLARRPSRSVPRWESGMISSSFSGQQPERMLADPTPVLHREVRRNPVEVSRQLHQRVFAVPTMRSCRGALSRAACALEAPETPSPAVTRITAELCLAAPHPTLCGAQAVSRITRLGRWLDPVGTLEEQAEQQREGR